MQLRVFAVTAIAGLAAGSSVAPKPSAAELRRYEGSTHCTGEYTVLSTDQLDQCTPYFIPAPASIKVVQKDDTTISSYHYQGTMDCSGPSQHMGDFVVNSCTNEGDYSQMRVWVTAPSPSGGTCEVPGDCGRAYQACCVGSEVKGEPCTCHLHNGTGTAGSADCGTCGKAFVACCTAAQLAGYGCTCDVMDGSSSMFVV